MNGMDGTIIKGLFQQFSTAEADHFVLKMAASGRGQLTMTTIQIGLFRE